jgi:elongation factor P
MIPATQLRVGMVIDHQGVLHRIVELNHVTPGKGRGMVHAKLRNLRTGNQQLYRYRSDEQADPLSLEQRNMEFLYHSPNEGYVFMNQETYDQIHVADEVLGEDARYLKENMKVVMEFNDDQPLGVELPMTVDLRIVETEPPLRGATASGSAKPAKLENGMTVRVPEYMTIGELVRVDTRNGAFIERA